MKVSRIGIVVVFIVLCLAFAVGASAGTGHEYENEILFREIPWGTNAKEVEKIFLDERFREDTWIIYPETLHELVPWFPKQTMKMVHPGKSFDISYPDFLVAGYKVSHIDLCFARIPDENGKIGDDDSLTAFYAASYEISTYNLESKISTVASDLRIKLTTLYGDMYDTDVVKRQYSEDKEMYYIWKGQNGTYVVLKYLDYDWNELTDEIFLYYLWENGDKMLKEADDILYAAAEAKATEPPYNTNNSDGL